MSPPCLPGFQRFLRKRPDLGIGGEAIAHHLGPDRLDPPHELRPKLLDRLEDREYFRNVARELAIDLGRVRMDLVLLLSRDPARVQYHVGELRSALNAAPYHELVVVATIELRGSGFEAGGLRPMIFRSHAGSPGISVQPDGCPARCSNSSIRLILLASVLTVNPL